MFSSENNLFSFVGELPGGTMVVVEEGGSNVVYIVHQEVSHLKR